jgi:hypothetical protein
MKDLLICTERRNRDEEEVESWLLKAHLAV